MSRPAHPGSPRLQVSPQSVTGCLLGSEPFCPPGHPCPARGLLPVFLPTSGGNRVSQSLMAIKNERREGIQGLPLAPARIYRDS